jgi:hypothetical protein
MDIAALSSSLSQDSLVEKAGVAVAKLAMNTDVQSSAELTKMMELSVNPNVGRNVDVSI